MTRTFLAAFAALALLAGSLVADDKQQTDKGASRGAAVTITKVDAKKGELTVKYTDDKGKEVQKTFQLTRDVRYLDETGRVVAVDVFEAGQDALVIATEGKLTELRRAAHPARTQRLSDAVRTLIEMTTCEQGCNEEVQRIYSMLRKLDTNKDGTIDPKELKAESDRILEERVTAAFERFDTNKDGKIAKDEAKGLMKEHFDHIDTNKDGFIDRDELRVAAKERRDEKKTTAASSEAKLSGKEKN